MKRRTMKYVGLIALFPAIGAIGASCSTSDDSNELTMWVDDSGWTASGGAVDAGIMCPGGVAQSVGHLELDGSPLAPEEAYDRIVEAIFADPPDVIATLLGLEEFTCNDGSGSFTVMMEARNGGPWSVSEGTGAYSDASMSGTIEIERLPVDDPDSPLADDPDPPPAGWPLGSHLTGTIEIAD